MTTKQGLQCLSLFIHAVQNYIVVMMKKTIEIGDAILWVPVEFGMQVTQIGHARQSLLAVL